MVYTLCGCLIMNKSDLLDKLIKKYSHLPPREVEKVFEKILATFVETLIGLRKPLSGECNFLDNNGLIIKNFKSISYIPQNCQFSGRTILL